MLNSVFILLLFVGGDGVPAHKVPDLERIQRRMHAGDAELRRLRGEAEHLIGTGGTGFVVIGKHNPELFLPSELMERVDGYLADEALSARYLPRWADRGAARFLGADYLPRLRKIVEKVIATQHEHRRLQDLTQSGKAADVKAAQAERNRTAAAICALRAEALAAARAEFGTEAFDRFLYEVVAPDAITIGSMGSTPESALDTAKWIERGCR